MRSAKLSIVERHAASGCSARRVRGVLHFGSVFGSSAVNPLSVATARLLQALEVPELHAPDRGHRYDDRPQLRYDLDVG